jgi:hypothetical protein
MKPEPPSCPHCRTSQEPERLGGGEFTLRKNGVDTGPTVAFVKWLCPCCSRVFSVRGD